ncbi:SDR family oxidoreductase [Jiangella aurantiaca]|uniref:SDR family oxidoreductase n=1 Tax=Jiangella aurantiaca TaxID=2530373 RepID=A0A4R5A6E9_9ACTN|nr:SDR family oxidoreductase [Jiangella aurantiaca]TDD65132.1 SDR family oxidoreductase [Jiangella aurantiaca]
MTAAAVPAGRTALITGASRGIGRALALGLADRGVAVGLVARRRETLDPVVEECRRRGVAAVGVTADVADRAEVVEAVEAVAGSLDRIDLLVNNAGAIEPVERRFLDTDVEDSWRVLEVNLRGPMLVTRAALPVMLAGGGGRIVGINSGMAYRALDAYTAYGVSKGALARFNASLAVQYGAQGVRAFEVAPGNVRTAMSEPLPMFEGRTEWTSPDAVVELVSAINDGVLDELSGRFFRAAADTVESLLAARERILDGDARVVRLVPYGPDDPLR